MRFEVRVVRRCGRPWSPCLLAHDVQFSEHFTKTMSYLQFKSAISVGDEVILKLVTQGLLRGTMWLMSCGPPKRQEAVAVTVKASGELRCGGAVYDHKDLLGQPFGSKVAGGYGCLREVHS